jgi:FAD/FMN-containing dehydrogenase
MALTSQSVVDAFRTRFAGEVVAPDDPSYDTARSVWNGAIDRRPAVIARCKTADDVAAAIGLARENSMELSVRGGGHSFAGFAVADDAVMIDLSAMRDVSVDPGTRRARCGGGTTWADLDGATQAHALAVPGGFISHTGVAGLTLGGGMGWLTRKAGLTCDNLVSAEVVTAGGRVLNASASENAELFWALRGGGGNFGVVTSFEFGLHEVGPMVNLGLFFWDVEHGADALRFAREFVKTLPAGMGAQIAGLSAPPEPFVPEQFHLMPGFGLLVAGFESPEQHAEAIAPIRDADPLFEFVTPLPYTALQQMFDEANGWGTFAYEKALYLDELTDGAIDVFVEYVPKKSSPLSFMPVFRLDGAYRDMSDDETAFGGSRTAGYVFNIAAICPTPELLEADREWARAFWSDLRPHATGAGSYVNFMNEVEEDRIRSAYGADKYDRLARIKAEYDPDNVFHLNPNIKPAG